LLSYAAEVGKDEGFNPPDAGDFNLPPFIEGNEFATKPILLVFLSVLLISIFFSRSIHSLEMIWGAR
jgi:F-type H+-transporting ATPase subunit a